MEKLYSIKRAGIIFGLCTAAAIAAPAQTFSSAVVVGPWVQQAELTATDGAAYDYLGWSVSVSGSTIALGARCHPASSLLVCGPGAAYVFVQDGTMWGQQAELTAPDGAAGDSFGESVAVSGSTVVVGANGHTVGSNQSQGAAYVFVANGDGTWSQQAELTASDGAAGDGFGSSVAISGSTVVVGASGRTVGSNQSQGAAYVFVANGDGTWSQQSELAASDGAAIDGFGHSVAVSGSTVAVGAFQHEVGSNSDQGAAYVFVANGDGTWSQQAELTSSHGAANDNFGWSVAVSGGTVVAGALYHMVGSNTEQGAAYVFARSGTRWSQQAELTASDGTVKDIFGESVAVDGSTIVVFGCRKYTTTCVQGAVYVFDESGGTWGQQAELIQTAGPYFDGFGISSAVSGSTVVAGAGYQGLGPNTDQGMAFVFEPGATTIQFSVPYLNFYNETVGITSSAKTATIKNVGAATLNITSIMPSAGFSISDSTCGTTLAAKKSCQVSVTFTPPEFGPILGPLTFTDSAVPSPQAVWLSGTGLAQAALTPASVTFANTKVGTFSTKHVTLKNNLPTSLTGISYSTTGPFRVSTICSTTLNSGAGCTLYVTFWPTQVGTATGLLTVTDSANNSPQTVSLSGTGD